MTFDLTEARRLHDRNPEDPEHCATCTKNATNYEPWPCPTASALGATGRSEWTDTATPNPCGRVYIHEAGWYHIGTGLDMTPDTTTEATLDTEATRCPSIAPGGLPCMGDTGHISRHWNTQTANRWLDPGQVPCAGVNPSGWRCDLTAGHNTNHHDQNGDTW